MQVGAAGVELASAVAFARHHLAHLVPVQHAQLGVGVVGGEVFGLPLEFRKVAPPGHREQIAGLPVAIDTMAFHALPEQGLGLFGQVPERTSLLATVKRLELEHVAALAAADLTAVSPRSPPAHARRLEQDYFVATLREMQRGGKTGVAAAHDAHVGADLPAQGRKGVKRMRGSGVPGIGVGDAHLAIQIRPPYVDRTRGPAGI